MRRNGATKKTNGRGDGYPDFIVVSPDVQPLIIGEAKAEESNIDAAVGEACDPYGEAFVDKGFRVLAAGIAGNDSTNIAVRIKKRAPGLWKPIEYRSQPIQWIPTPEETHRLLSDDRLFELQPLVPSNDVLAKRGEDINRILRESGIKDEYRPSVMAAFMLGIWYSHGDIRTDAAHVLKDINEECRQAFVKAGKSSLTGSIAVPENNRALAQKAARICYILRLLNVTTLTTDHDYLGQLYESFFRFTGGNTIGQYFTPRHVARLMTNLCEVSRSDLVVDPTCGTGGFLLSALYRMMGSKQLTHDQVVAIVKDHLMGFEKEPTTAALCVANMILRGDGTTGVVHGDCFTHPDYPVGQASVVLGNPPFPHKNTDTPADAFVDRGLEATTQRGAVCNDRPQFYARNKKGVVRKDHWRTHAKGRYYTSLRIGNRSPFL